MFSCVHEAFEIMCKKNWWRCSSFYLGQLIIHVKTDLDNVMPICIETAFVDSSDGASCKFTVGVVYRPPDGDLLDFYVNNSDLI